MTFVFEARRLPFGNNNSLQQNLKLETYNNNNNNNNINNNFKIDEEALADLPEWKKRLFPHVMEVVRQYYHNNNNNNNNNTKENENKCWIVTMRIIEELAELELAYERALEYRTRQSSGKMTAEEIMLEELLKERMGGEFLREESEENENNNNNNNNNNNSDSDEEDDSIDIAMCFNLDGEVMSIGSAGIFGNHGYHK